MKRLQLPLSRQCLRGILGALTLLAGTAAAIAEGVNGPLPVNWPGALPAPGPVSANPVMIIPRPEGELPQAPEGFEVELWADGLVGPRYMALTPEGEVLVSLMEAGQVIRLDAERRPQVLVEGLLAPFGLAFIDGKLYVADVKAVRRYAWPPEGGALGPAEVLVDISAYAAGHKTRTLLPDGQGGFFLSIGSDSNVSAGEPPARAAISHYAADGSGGRLYATGIRNPVGLRLNPVTGALWATSQERDGLGDDLVPDFFTEVVEGAFYGWPYAYIGPHEDPRHPGAAPDKVAATRYPSVLLGGHVGALDFVFYTGTAFPERFRQGAFIALHGSWNHSRRVGHQVVFVPFKDGHATAGPEPFLTGFKLGEQRREAWGRPVGLLELPDGSLLISDDGGNCIWRVSANP